MIQPVDTEYVLAYVPEISNLSWGEAVDLAFRRDEEAADQLSDDMETVLNLEAAADLINGELEDFYNHVDWAEILSPVDTGRLIGYLN